MLQPSAVADIHPSLEKVILKAMAREPEDRYQTVAEILSDLEATEEASYTATLVLSNVKEILPDTIVPEHPPAPKTVAQPKHSEQQPKGWQRLLRFFNR
jgi:hypothetical protein